MVLVFGSDVPAIVAVMLFGEIAVFCVYLVAVLFAAVHRGKPHHYMMLAAFLTDILVFKPLMSMRAFGDVWGGYPWSGTSILRHMVLDTITLVVGIATIYLGFKYRVKRENKMFMPPARKKIHRVVGTSFIILWLVTLVVGISIFVESYLP